MIFITLNTEACSKSNGKLPQKQFLIMPILGDGGEQGIKKKKPKTVGI